MCVLVRVLLQFCYAQLGSSRFACYTRTCNVCVCVCGQWLCVCLSVWVCTSISQLILLNVPAVLKASEGFVSHLHRFVYVCVCACTPSQSAVLCSCVCVCVRVWMRVLLFLRNSLVRLYALSYSGPHHVGYIHVYMYVSLYVYTYNTHIHTYYIYISCAVHIVYANCRRKKKKRRKTTQAEQMNA